MATILGAATEEVVGERQQYIAKDAAASVQAAVKGTGQSGGNPNQGP